MAASAAIAMATFAVAGCSGEVFETIGRYDVPESRLPPPEGFPNVFSQSGRTDTLRCPEEVAAIQAELEAARDGTADDMVADTEREKCPVVPDPSAAGAQPINEENNDV